jgi:transposase-like protein
MEQRREFVRLAMQEGANRRELCRRFGIHPDTGYKWLSRWQADQDLADRSRGRLEAGEITSMRSLSKNCIPSDAGPLPWTG